MVSLVPGVNPVSAAVVNCAQVRGFNTGSVIPSVMEAYSVMGVPPPMASEPATSEDALTVPLTVWFPLKLLLPVVTAAPGSLTVWRNVPELGAKAGVSGEYLDFSYVVAAGDYDNVGWTDLFIANNGKKTL